MEKILRQLEAQKENADQQSMLVQQILSKFLTEEIINLEESKSVKEIQNVTLLRDSMLY